VKMTPEERFWLKVDKNGPIVYPGIGRCWEWHGGTFNHGYGIFLYNKKPSLAHRISWIFTHGSEPKFPGASRTFLLHRCDNRLCVNPAHLRPGTAKENADDMVKRKRVAKGERASRTKLTERDVREILSSELTTKELARKFDVYYSCIWKIRHGLLWGHLKETA